MQSPRRTSKGDVEPVVACTPAENDVSAPTSAAAPTDLSPNAAAAAKRAEGMALLGPASLLTGEDRDAWEKLHEEVCSTVEPADIFEKMWTRDIVDHEWNILRLRRLSAALISATLQRGLEQVLRPLISGGTGGIGNSRVEILAWKFTHQDKEAIREVNELLEAVGLSWETVLAQTMTINVENIERFDRMCTIAEARRDAALREIDRRQPSLGQRVRRAVHQLRSAGHQVIVESDDE